MNKHSNISFSSTPASCTTLLPLYHAWGQGIAVAKEALHHYLQEGTDTAHASLLTQLSALKQTQETFLELSQRPSSYQNQSCPQLERLALETMEALVKRLPDVSSNGQRIIRLDLSGSQASSTSLTSACTLVPLLASLQGLLCYNTQITVLPETLPQGIRYINIQNTPAASDQKVRAFLQAFRAQHQGVEVGM